MKLNMRIFAILISAVLLTQSISPTPSEISFIDVPQKKMVGKLKSVAFATIRTSIIKEYQFTEPKEIRYVPCSPDFPSLPGDFPCSLLSWDEEAVTIDEISKSEDSQAIPQESSVDDELGGKVIVLISKTKSPNIDGKVLRLGDDEDALKLFYDKEGYLSHYTFKSSVIVFRWKNVENIKVLVGILLLKLDSNFFPLSAREIVFPRS
jgi:hypothetical protein